MGCPLGGTASRVCNELGVPREITATFDNCEIPAPSGSLVLDGTATLSSDIGTCPNVLLSAITEAVDLKLLYRDSEGTMQRAVSAELTAAVSSLRGLDSPCFYTGISAVVNGLIQIQAAGGGGVDVDLNDTEIVADVVAYSPACLAVESRQTLDGAATLTDFPGGRAYPIDFLTYEIHRVASQFAVALDIIGKAGGPCFGGGATLTTIAPVQLPMSDVCPVGGTILVETTFAPLNTLFYGEGGVDVDEDGDGEADASYPSCTAAPACD